MVIRKHKSSNKKRINATYFKGFKKMKLPANLERSKQESEINELEKHMGVYIEFPAY